MARRFLPLVATFLFPHLDFQKQKVRMSTCTKLTIATLLTEHKVLSESSSPWRHWLSQASKVTVYMDCQKGKGKRSSMWPHLSVRM